jgi:hypothetical protein
MRTNTLNIVKRIMVTREKKRHLLRAAVLVGGPDAHRTYHSAVDAFS